MSRNNTKRLTVCAMLAALGVILLYIGSLIEVVDISMAVVASMLSVIAVIEYGKGTPWFVFFATAVLGCILAPPWGGFGGTLYYVAFFGFYPILKEYFERMSKVKCWICKEVVFNVCLAVLIVVLKLLFFSTVNIPIPMYVMLVVLCEIVFVLYDVALTRLITFYIYRLRDRLKLK